MHEILAGSNVAASRNARTECSCSGPRLHAHAGLLTLQALKRRGISLSSLKAVDGNSCGTADALTAAQQERNDALAAAAAAHADAERAQKREHAKSLEISSLQRALKEATQRADAGSKYLQRKVSMEVGAAEAQVWPPSDSVLPDTTCACMGKRTAAGLPECHQSAPVGICVVLVQLQQACWCLSRHALHHRSSACRLRQHNEQKHWVTCKCAWQPARPQQPPAQWVYCTTKVQLPTSTLRMRSWRRRIRHRGGALLLR